jgi:sortase A
MTDAMKNKHLRTIQIVLMIVGVSLLAIFVTAYIHRKVLSRAALESFRQTEEQRPSEKEVRSFADKRFTFDFSLWSPKRIADYETSLTASLSPPIGILRIVKAHLEVPVLDGVDDVTLNRGVGYIPGTAHPGERGNVGIAGHRDGFFRILKDVGKGDEIELETLDKIDIYQIKDIVIVDKNDPSVLRPSSVPTLTLVTCYPFYFIGSAPKRYIVVASLVTSGASPDARRPTSSGPVVLEPAPQDPNLQSQKPTKERTL